MNQEINKQACVFICEFASLLTFNVIFNESLFFYLDFIFYVILNVRFLYYFSISLQ